MTERTDKGHPSRGAILLSGVVYPGVGQLVQRRWAAAVLFAGVFSALFGLLMVRSMQIVVAYYRLGLDGAAAAEEMPSIRPILGLFGCGLLVYVANIADAYLAHRRRARRYAVQRHFDLAIASLLEQDE